MKNIDVGIIGGGPAGFTSAIYYAKQGKSVILFEKDELGGTCLNRGCIPTKAFLHVADLYAQIKDVDKIGINCQNISLDFEKVKSYKNNIVSKLRKALELTLKSTGVVVVKSNAQLIDKKTIRTVEDEYVLDKIIVATGSKPKEIGGLKFDHKFILSSDDILELDNLPQKILIVGSGAIGIEWARIFSSFDVEVSLVELADRLCPLADWEVSKRIERQFKMRKIRTFISSSVVKTEGKKAILSGGEILEPDCILVAVGRDVEEIDNMGADVIGDASSEIMLAHYAVSQAKELVLDIPFDRTFVPSVIYGAPEIAWIGEVSKSKENDEKYDKSFIPISALGKAHCDNSIDGFIKILAKDGFIKGVSVVSNEASALIQQIAIAMVNKISVDELKKICFAHPTYSEGILEGIMTL